MDGRSLRTDYTGSSKGWFHKGEHGPRYKTGERWKIKICDVCGNEFSGSDFKGKRTCSKKCQYILSSKAQSRSIIRYCAFCHKQFSMPPSRIRRGDGTYCSKKCAYSNKIGYTKLEKSRANNAIRIAVEKGIIKKQSCAICKNPDTQAHHHKSYKKEDWFNVVWLCRLHHLGEHARLRRLGLANLL